MIIGVVYSSRLKVNIKERLDIFFFFVRVVFKKRGIESYKV